MKKISNSVEAEHWLREILTTAVKSGLELMETDLK